MADEMSKGVMLCERPADPSTAMSPAAPPSDSQPPFKTAVVASEQLGLNPIPTKPKPQAAKANSALSKHMKWISDLEKSEKEKREQKELDEQDKLSKKERLADFSANLRSSIMAGKDVSNTWAAVALLKKRSQALAAAEGGPPLDAAAEDVTDLDAEMLALVDGALEANTVKELAKKAAAPKKKPQLPAWALTEDAFEEQAELEEAELLDFVDDLDYEKYIESCDDDDLRMALEAMNEAEKDADSLSDAAKDEKWKKNFVIAMNSLAGKDAIGAAGGMDFGDMRSEMGGSAVSAAKKARAAAAEASERGSQWDASTKMGGDDSIDVEKRKAAEYLLSEDPDLRKVHTAKSLQKIMESGEPAAAEVF